ncbi:unknown [Bacteroides sp. CAG:633]|nr:unknown [Bacteroides sp. CAG:633]
MLVWLTRLVFATAEIEAKKESEAHKYAVSAPEKPCFGGAETLVRLVFRACSAGEQRLCGSRTMLVRLVGNACSGGKQGFSARKIAFSAFGNLVFFLFQMSVFCYRSVSEANAEFRFRFFRRTGCGAEISDSRRVGDAKCQNVDCRLSARKVGGWLSAGG